MMTQIKTKENHEYVTLSNPISESLAPYVGPIPAIAVTSLSAIGSPMNSRCFTDVDIVIKSWNKTPLSE